MRAPGRPNIFLAILRAGKRFLYFGIFQRFQGSWYISNITEMNCRMYFLYGATHENFVWEARMEPGVIDVFSKLWETRKLIVAFDGFNVSLPNRTDAKWSPWPHCDQSPNRKG
jgi:hypothetical protein